VAGGSGVAVLVFPVPVVGAPGVGVAVWVGGPAVDGLATDVLVADGSGVGVSVDVATGEGVLVAGATVEVAVAVDVGVTASPCWAGAAWALEPEGASEADG